MSDHKVNAEATKLRELAKEFDRFGPYPVHPSRVPKLLIEAADEIDRLEKQGSLRVVAVAVRTADGMVHSLPAPARHHSVVHQLHALGHPQLESDEQGFLLSDGTFCRRKPAKRIATEAGQLLARESGLVDLYSEDVW